MSMNVVFTKIDFVIELVTVCKDTQLWKICKNNLFS